ncbi:MAG: GTP-binding protein [Proteobacteria bacterium]|nr:GTP-binding protein [Pseudomonadota bacterium]
MTTVAILGRPNVGKSTLFNRLTAGAGSPAITHATAGTTRDARLCPAELFGLTFTLVDTAGVEEGKGQTELQGQLNTLALAAVAKADVLILLLDAASGLMPADRALAQHARKLNRPVIVVLNKADLKTALAHSVEVESLGFGQPIMLSAAHNQGFEDLHTALALHVTAGQQPSGSAQPTVAAPRPPRLSRSAHKAALAATAGSQPSTATPASAGTEFRIPNSVPPASPSSAAPMWENPRLSTP